MANNLNNEFQKIKILLWNCNSGLGRKEQINQLKSYDCDLAIIPELRESNIELIKPSDAVWKTNNHKTRKPKG